MSKPAAVPDVSTQASIGSGLRPSPMLAWGGLLLILLARGYRAFLVTLVVAATAPTLWSWSSHVVQSGSMEPGLSRGDLVVGKPHPAADPVPLGRVMIFANPDTASRHEVLVHRVVERLAPGQYATAGDANRDHDSTAVPARNFTERAVICVPFVGLPVIWLSQHELAPLLAWLVITVLALYSSARPPCDPRHRRRKELSRERRAAERAGTVLRRAAVPTVGAVTIAVAAIVGVPLAQAGAAFTSTAYNAASTWQVSTTIAKSVVLADPGELVRGSVPLTVTLANVGALSYAVRIEYAAAGSDDWQTLCTQAAAPYACSWATTGFANGHYDLRAISTSGFTMFTSPVVADILVDNAAPTVIMHDPGTPLRGTVTLTAAVSDVDSGISRTVIQRASTGSSTWTDVCTDTDEPYSCRFDTTTVAAGSYSFRAVGTDGAGNSATSPLVTNRVVDNTVSAVSLEDPGAHLAGSVPLVASASSTAGVTSVRIQRATAGMSAWTDICTDGTSPYSCTWNTAAPNVPDGLYDLRAVLLDGAGTSTTSAIIAGRQVDNSPLRAYDVQTSGSGGSPGKLNAGDTITFTYSQQVKLSTITAGWTGSAMSVTVRLRDGLLLGTGTSGDLLDVTRSGAAVNLGSVNLKQDYITTALTAEFAGTLTASTTTVNGGPATRVTVVVGNQSSGLAVRTSTASSTMLWTPATVVTDLLGRAISSSPATESGPADWEF